MLRAHRTPSSLSLGMGIVTAAVLVLLSGCGRGPAETEKASSDTQDEAAGGATATPTNRAARTSADGLDLYTVRAEVSQLPPASEPQDLIILHHEAIDDMKGIGGEVWGMDSMTMPFAVAKGVSLEGLAEGDKVEIQLAIDWTADPPQVIREIQKLPPDTQLVFRKARPVGSAQIDSASATQPTQ